MKTEKEEIDQLIEQALSNDEAEFYRKLDEQNLVEMFGGLFQGKMKWLAILTVFVQLTMFGFAVYFIYRFFTTEDLKQMIQFGATSFFFLLSSTMMKLFHWMQMDKNAIIRELKRVELQLSVLASRLKSEK